MSAPKSSKRRVATRSRAASRYEPSIAPRHNTSAGNVELPERVIVGREMVERVHALERRLRFVESDLARLVKLHPQLRREGQ